MAERTVTKVVDGVRFDWTCGKDSHRAIVGIVDEQMDIAVRGQVEISYSYGTWSWSLRTDDGNARSNSYEKRDVPSLNARQEVIRGVVSQVVEVMKDSLESIRRRRLAAEQEEANKKSENDAMWKVIEEEYGE